MNEIKDYVPSGNQLICSGAAGVIGVIVTKIFGEWNDSIFALLVLMAIDFAMGLIVAGLFQKSTKTISGGLSSKECVKGIAKKVCELLLVAAAYQGDKLLEIDYTRTFVIWGLCAAEIISIMENAGAMEILPPTVQKVFGKIIDVLNRKANKNEWKSEDD